MNFNKFMVKCEWKKCLMKEFKYMSSSGSGTVNNYGSGSDYLTSYCSCSGSTSQKVTVPTVPVPVPGPVPQHCTQALGLPFMSFLNAEKRLWDCLCDFCKCSDFGVLWGSTDAEALGLPSMSSEFYRCRDFGVVF